MSDSFINQVTIDYLINPDVYKKCKTVSITKSNINNDKKFYRKRIISLTKELLLNKEVTVSPDIEYAFNNYIKSCINNFRTIDNNDIIQEDYTDLIKDEQSLDNLNDKLNDKLINMNSFEITKKSNESLFNINKKTSTLNNFIIRNKPEQQSAIFLPKERNINLKDPVLRKKGVKYKKKKNIDSMYDNEDQKETKI